MAAASPSIIDMFTHVDQKIKDIYTLLKKDKNYEKCSELITKSDGKLQHIDLTPPSILLIQGAESPAGRVHLRNCIEALHQKNRFYIWLESILNDLDQNLLRNLILAIRESESHYALMLDFLNLFRDIVRQLNLDDYFLSEAQFQRICQICDKNFWQTWLRQLAESKDFDTERVIAYFFECIPDTVDPAGTTPGEDLRDWLSKETKTWCIETFELYSDEPPAAKLPRSISSQLPPSHVSLAPGSTADAGVRASPSQNSQAHNHQPALVLGAIALGAPETSVTGGSAILAKDQDFWDSVIEWDLESEPESESESAKKSNKRTHITAFGNNEETFAYST